mgnify:CR=1 FL=1|jgi:hypothetical protein
MYKKSVKFSKTLNECKTYNKTEYDRSSILSIVNISMTYEEFKILKRARIEASKKHGMFNGSPDDFKEYTEYNQKYRENRISKKI